MRPYRSLLFVPAHRAGWPAKAAAAGADAIILDLEDSVPPGEKDAARPAAARAIDELAADHPGVGVLVRPNAWETGRLGADLAAVVRPGLTGVLLPKLYRRDDLVRVDGLLGYFEAEAGLPAYTVEILASLETAPAAASMEEIIGGPRVAGAMAAAARDGDFAREMGYEWSPAGLETLYFRSRTVLACRAAGRHPVVGLWQELGDLAGLRDFAAANRALGFRGQVVIHPSHVPVVNEAYSPTPAQLDRYRAMIAAFEAARESGTGAVEFDGEHIDIAHVTTAREILALAAEQDRRTHQ
jgi:citrate lyase subunit beta/citryl-CoA lyase